MKTHNKGGGVVSPIMTPDDVRKSEIYAKFVRFMAVPDPDRCEMLGISMNRETGLPMENPTLTKFAQHFGVHLNTLRNWKMKPEFQKAVTSFRKDWGKDRTANVMAALYRNILRNGNAYDVELWMAYMENWDRKQVVKIVQEEFTANDIRTIISRLPKDQQNEWYTRIGELVTLAELHGGGDEVPQDSTERPGGGPG